MQAQPTTVLIIDDDEIVLLGLRLFLEQAGYRVLTAADGDAGLRLIQEHSPDVIVCDVVMPAPDGFALRRILSGRQDVADIPFIFLTARSAREDKLSGLDLGADDYITKPYDPQELVARIKAVLRRKELGREKGRAEARAQMEELRREFLKNITHELRTPMAELITNLDMVLTQKFGDNLGEQKLFLQGALSSAHRLRDLIEDLLALTQLDQGKFSNLRQTVDLEYDFRRPVEQRLQLWQGRHLETHLQIEPGVVLYAPRKGFKQSAVHLVDNACKFSPQAGWVGILLAANGPGGAILTVADQGPGIPVELRDKVFERYFQASQGDARLYGGLGVGLTIARAFARGIGGDVVILDSANGCRVQMIVPPAPADWDTRRQGPQSSE
jgi:two-component system sensor histidine kinase/response regulator